jgi:nucleotide-binding universal stress UspA family protein
LRACTAGDAYGGRYSTGRPGTSAATKLAEGSAGRASNGIELSVHAMQDQTQPYVILCALQFDETGVRALETAVRLTRGQANAELHVVHVVGSQTAASLRGEADYFRARCAQAPRELRARIDRACRHSGLKVHAYIREGDPEKQILRTATEVVADLIVVGTHRRTGLSRIVDGSVVERVLHDAPCSVLVACPLPSEVSRDAAEVDRALP